MDYGTFHQHISLQICVAGASLEGFNAVLGIQKTHTGHQLELLFN